MQYEFPYARSLEEFLNVFRSRGEDYFWRNPDHVWDAWRLGFELDDVFTKLPRQFNMMAFPILSPEAFRVETQQVASIARDRAEFEQLLESRMEDKRKEHLLIMQEAISSLVATPRQMTKPTREVRKKTQSQLLMFCRSKAFSDLSRYFAGFLHDKKFVNEITSASTDPAPATAASPRTRKRCREDDAEDEDQDEARPSKRIRSSEDEDEESTDDTPETPNPFNYLLVPAELREALRKDDEPSASPAVTAPRSALVEAVPGVDTNQRDHTTVENGGKNPAEPKAEHEGNAEPDRGRPMTENKAQETPAQETPAQETPAQETPAQDTGRQGSRRPQPRRGAKRQKALQSPHNKPPSSKIHKKPPASSARPDKKKAKTAAQAKAKDSRGKGGAQQTRSSPRLTRRRGLADGSLQELDSHGKARLVEA